MNSPILSIAISDALDENEIPLDIKIAILNALKTKMSIENQLIILRNIKDSTKMQTSGGIKQR